MLSLRIMVLPVPACALLTFFTIAGNAAGAELCPPLVLNALPYVSWDSDTSYELDVRKDTNDKLNVRITGDIIRLDNTNFPSLLRGKDYSPDNIGNITFDARIIQIAGPLTLKKGNINFYAEQLSFEPNGTIALTSPPGENGDGIHINVKELDFRHADSIPLQISLQYADKRRLMVNTEKIFFPAFVYAKETDAQTLWQLSNNDTGGLPRSLPSTWDINTGIKGGQNAINNMATVAEWPSFFVYKLRKYHAYSPFDPKSQQTILKQIEKIMPYIMLLQRADVLLDLNRLDLLIQNNTDSRGYGPGLVPSEDFYSAKERFTKDIVDSKQQFQNLINVIVATAPDRELNKDIINSARVKINALSNAQSRLKINIGDTITTLGNLQAQAKSISEQIELERIASQKTLESLKKRDNDLANIKAVTTIVAVGASVIGSPAVGAAIVAGVSAAGDMIYAHNSGAAINVETLATVVQKNSELYAEITRVRGAWSRHREDLTVLEDVFRGKTVTHNDTDKPLTRTDVVQLAGKSASEFSDAIKAMITTLGKTPRPDSLSLNQVESENSALQQELSHLVQVQLAIADQTLRLQSLQSAFITGEAAQSDAELVEQRLLNLDPVNDVDNRRWRSVSMQLWNREIRRLYQEAMDLRLSLFYLTWKTPDLPESFDSYPEEITACIDAKRCQENLFNWTESDLRKILGYQADRHLALLSGFNSALEDAWQDFQSERASGSQPFFEYQEFSSSEGSPLESQFLINQINAQIHRQITFPETRDRGQFRIEIPVTMISPPVPGQPERLLKVGIADPVFRNNTALKGKTVMFDITWPLAGELMHDNTCSRVSLSVPGGQLSKTVRDQANDPVSLLKARSDAPITLESLMESRTAPPARTSYYLSVTIGGSAQDLNWNNVPVLERLTFWRRIVQ